MLLKDKYEDWLEYLRQKGFSEGTIKEYRRHLFGSLSHSVQDTKLKKFTLADCAKIAEAGKKHGRYGPLRALSCFRRYFKYLKFCGIKIPFDWRDIELRDNYVPSPEVVALTPEEREYVFDSVLGMRGSWVNPQTGKRGKHINPYTTSYRLRALMETLYATGMRIGEAVKLLRAQIPWETKELRIDNNKTKARGEAVYFTDRALKWISEYLDRRADSHPALFVNQQGTKPLTTVCARHSLRYHIKGVEKEIGKHIHFHLLRKTFCSDLLLNGADIKSVQYLARHRSERTTLKYYTAINKSRAKEVHQRILGAVDK